MAAKKKKIDWEIVEREYRTGHLSVREIARQQGCTHTAIQKRAKNYKWTRDLSSRVRSEVYRKVAKKVSRLATKITDDALVDAESDKGADVLISHRILLGTARDKISEALRGLEREDIDAVKKVKTLKDIASSLKDILPLERQAYNIDERSTDREHTITIIYDK